jgi:hypothetical protein
LATTNTLAYFPAEKKSFTTKTTNWSGHHQMLKSKNRFFDIETVDELRRGQQQQQQQLPLFSKFV